MVKTQVNDTIFSGCEVFGIAAWDLVGRPRDSSNLTIRRERGGPVLTVDRIELAHFLFLLIQNEQLRNVIDMVTSKVVLILGRFTEERKKCLDTIRDQLRTLDSVPVLFDFQKPENMSITGTVETVAKLAHFVIADISDSSSVPHELATIVSRLTRTPIILLQAKGSNSYSMASDLRDYPWVVGPLIYDSCESLVPLIRDIVSFAAQNAAQLRKALLKPSISFARSAE